MEEIRRSPVEVGSLSHYLQGFSTIPGGAGFLNHQQYHMQTDCKRDDNVRGTSVEDFGLDDHGFSHYQEFGFTFFTPQIVCILYLNNTDIFKYIYIIFICFQCAYL